MIGFYVAAVSCGLLLVVYMTTQRVMSTQRFMSKLGIGNRQKVVSRLWYERLESWNVESVGRVVHSSGPLAFRGMLANAIVVAIPSIVCREWPVTITVTSIEGLRSLAAGDRIEVVVRRDLETETVLWASLA